MLAIPFVHALPLSSVSTAAVPLTIVLCALIVCAALVAGFLWLRERMRRRDQRRTRSLQRLTVAQLMEPATAGVPITMTLAELAHEYAATAEKSSVHVTQWGQLVGMISRKDMRRMPEERWEATRIGAAMTPLECLLTLEPEQSLLEAYRLMLHRDVHHTPVVVRGRVVGMLNLETVRQLTAEQPPTRVNVADSRQRLPVAN